MSGREWTFELKLRVSKTSRLSHSLSYLPRHNFFDQHISHLSFDILHFISKLFFHLLLLLLQLLLLLLLVLASVQRWVTPVLISLSFTLGHIFSFLLLFDQVILRLLIFIIFWTFHLSTMRYLWLKIIREHLKTLVKTFDKYKSIMCPIFLSECEFQNISILNILFFLLLQNFFLYW